MKKFVYLALAFVISMFTSCTDKEDVEIIQHRDLVLNINTSSAYEEWSMTSFQNLLGNNESYYIGVTSLIYNAKGVLCDSLFSSTKTFQSVSQTIKALEEGSYTVVTLETIVDKNDKYQSTAWKLDKTNDLDSVRVVYKEGRSNAYWYEMFALATTNISIGKDNTYEITPSTIGTWVSLGYENFEKSQFNYFSLATKNPADGYFLGPNHTGNRYYRTGFDKSNVWGRIAYHWNRDLLPTSDDATFYIFETGRKTCMFGAAKKMWIDGNVSYDYSSDDFAFNFESGKWYSAYCYYKGRPEVFESFIGLSSEFSSWYSKLDKTMNPIYAEPCITWGSSVSYVKTFMRGYEILQDITEGVGGYFMAYAGKYMENFVEYDFTEKSTGLFSAYVCILEEDASMDDIMAYLNESSYTYDKLYEEDNFSYHLYYDDKTYVAVMPRTFDDGTQATMVQYLSRAYSDGQGANARSRVLAKRVHQYGKSNFKLK